MSETINFYQFLTEILTMLEMGDDSNAMLRIQDKQYELKEQIEGFEHENRNT